MTELTNSVVYILLFISLYFEIFILITYLELRPSIKQENKRALEKLKHYPTIAIMVPCWNEETTISKTIHSLLNLDYPKDKLEIIAIDDGSTDKTWEMLQKFSSYPQIKLFTKENGGKHTALNFGLTQSKSDMVGCLDADSYVDKNALKYIVQYFEDKQTMAVTPAVKIYKPENMLQTMQSIEYGWGIFLRKILASLGALYVTPGPFSIFRREVFEKIGNYRHAYNTEDMEIAMRMQAHHMKITNAHNANVYTVAPRTLKKLYKQRIRWTFGFIKNVIDYRYIFFRKQYGNLGIFILPFASLSIVAGIYLMATTIWNISQSMTQYIEKIMTIGFSPELPTFSFNIFSVNTEVVALAGSVAFFGTVAMVLISRKMATGKLSLGMDLVYFLTLYTFIAPIWLTKAMFNAVFSIKTTWR
jgi:cellulose synthase/poly-beta-1,6-N-acetylglucosamine synthase-like glycosyltransferase